MGKEYDRNMWPNNYAHLQSMWVNYVHMSVHVGIVRCTWDIHIATQAVMFKASRAAKCIVKFIFSFSLLSTRPTSTALDGC